MAVPVIGFAALSGTGKTTLLVRLLPLLKAKGLRVGVIKHAHHTFDLDTPGKDSYELRKAGADQTLVASRRRWALMVETGHEKDEPEIEALIQRLPQQDLDLILVEGFKLSSLPKIELHRAGRARPIAGVRDSTVVAVATDGELPSFINRPVLDLNDPASIADFICEKFSLSSQA